MDPSGSESEKAHRVPSAPLIVTQNARIHFPKNTRKNNNTTLLEVEEKGAEGSLEILEAFFISPRNHKPNIPSRVFLGTAAI